VSPTGADGETTKTVLASLPATTRNRTNLPYASQEGKGKPGLPLPREFQRDISENLDSTTPWCASSERAAVEDRAMGASGALDCARPATSTLLDSRQPGRRARLIDPTRWPLALFSRPRVQLGTPDLPERPGAGGRMKDEVHRSRLLIAATLRCPTKEEIR
jgi:hypothetical protein